MLQLLLLPSLYFSLICSIHFLLFSSLSFTLRYLIRSTSQFTGCKQLANDANFFIFSSFPRHNNMFVQFVCGPSLNTPASILLMVSVINWTTSRTIFVPCSCSSIFTWNVLHFQCMFHRFDIHRFGMDRPLFDSFYRRSLKDKSCEYAKIGKRFD